MNYALLWAQADAFYAHTSQHIKAPIRKHDYAMRHIQAEESAWRRVLRNGDNALVWAWLDAGQKPPFSLLKRVRDKSTASLLLTYLSRQEMGESYYHLLYLTRQKETSVLTLCQEKEWIRYVTMQHVHEGVDFPGKEHPETVEHVLWIAPFLWRQGLQERPDLLDAFVASKSTEERVRFLEHHSRYIPKGILARWIHQYKNETWELSRQAAMPLLTQTIPENIYSPLMTKLWEQHGHLNGDFQKMKWIRLIGKAAEMREKVMWPALHSVLHRTEIKSLITLLSCWKHKEVREEIWNVLSCKTNIENLRGCYHQYCDEMNCIDASIASLEDFIQQHKQIYQSESALLF